MNHTRSLKWKLAVVGAMVAVALRGRPAFGLGGNDNYVWYSPGTGGTVCQPIQQLTVTIHVTQDIVSNIGFSFQLNGTSPPDAYQAFQQYVFGLVPQGSICVGCRAITYQLDGQTEPWPGPGANGTVKGNIANQRTTQKQTFAMPTLPAGYTLVINLSNDAKHNVSQVQYVASDPNGVVVLDETMDIASLAPKGGQGGTTIGSAALSPLVGFQLDLVGPTNGYHTHLSSGAGTITYSVPSATPLVSATALPKGCADAGTGTLENSNSTYGTVAAGPTIGYTQSFDFAAQPPYTPGGAIAAAPGNAGLNNLFVVSADAQLVPFTASATGTLSAGNPVISDHLMYGGDGLVAVSGPGGVGTYVLGVEQDGGATAYVLDADGTWETPLLIPPTNGLQRFSANPVALPRVGVPSKLDLYIVDNNGEIGDSTLDAGGSWAQPVLITPAGVLGKSASLAATPRFGVANETDVLGVDVNGRMFVVSVVGDGTWSGQQVLDPAPSPSLSPGAPLAVSQEFGSDTKTDVFVVDKNGDLTLFSAIANGSWSAPTAINPPGALPVGGHLVATRQFEVPNRTAVYAFDKLGQLNVYFTDGGGVWMGPIIASSPGLAPPGANIVAMHDTAVPSQTDLFFIDATGQPHMLASVAGATTVAPSPMGMPMTGAAHGCQMGGATDFSGAPIMLLLLCLVVLRARRLPR